MGWASIFVWTFHVEAMALPMDKLCYALLVLLRDFFGLHLLGQWACICDMDFSLLRR